MKTINKRIETLEENMPTQANHDYLMVIRLNEFDKVENQYFRDGMPILREEYEREAPKEPGKINIHWVEVNPERGNDENDKQAG